MEISYQVPSSNNVIYYFTNIEKGQAYGVSVYKNFQIKPWWNLFFQKIWSITKIISRSGWDIYQNKVWNWVSNISTSFTLDKNSDWKMEVGHNYYSPGIQGPFRFPDPGLPIL
jgi:hypothetical protein